MFKNDKKQTILIVEDDDRMRYVLREFMERSNFSVIEAKNGEEALELYKKSPTDLIITDILMPKKDGLVFINELHQSFPNAAVICISGGISGDTSVLEPISKSLGAFAFLTKPIRFEDLIECVNEVLKKSGSKTGPTLLLVEDDQKLQMVLEQALELENFQVLCANNGQEAVDIFQENSVDLVITDLVMPEKDGLKTIEELRQLSPNVKIIVISGLAMSNTSLLQKPSTYGALKLLKKPFSNTELIAAVNEALALPY